jgi:hypothetical protein
LTTRRWEYNSHLLNLFGGIIMTLAGIFLSVVIGIGIIIYHSVKNILESKNCHEKTNKESTD